MAQMGVCAKYLSTMVLLLWKTPKGVRETVQAREKLGKGVVLEVCLQPVSRTECLCPHQNSCVEILMLHVILLGGGAFGR